MKPLGAIAFFVSSLRSSRSNKIRRLLNSFHKMSAQAGTPTTQNLLSYHIDRLKSSPNQCLLLDGGTGEELFLHGVPDDRKIWSATAIIHDKYHSTLERVHRSFIEAGSQAITTNSYGIIPGVGFTDGEEVKRLMGIAGEIARRSVTTDSGTASALVLGSLGPLVESYRPDLIMNHEDGVRCYQYGIQGLNPHVDVYLAETMSCLEEACQVIDALSTLQQGVNESDDKLFQKRPLLVSFTLRSDGNLRSGESVVVAIPKMVSFSIEREVERECSIAIGIFSLFDCCRSIFFHAYFKFHTVIGILFNCCEPEAITKAIREIVSNPQIHQYLHHPPSVSSSKSSHYTTLDTQSSKIFLGAYANKLTPVDPSWTMASSDGAQPMRSDLSPAKYWENFVRHWNNGDGRDDGGIGGIQMIGGCCGIGPSHISYLRDNLRSNVSSNSQ
ncbi:hypothetical protein ACHAW6_007776 [Cyclotella cf. meneghiniana]